MKRLVGIVTVCVRCGHRYAKWVVLSFPMCDECAREATGR